MCGIFIVNDKFGDAFSLCKRGLKAIEYRGYDGHGFYVDGDIIKHKGSINSCDCLLIDKNSNLSIGHTRWSTSGDDNINNLHPIECGDFVVVHNGIINANILEDKSNLPECVSNNDTSQVAILLQAGYTIQEIVNEINEKNDRPFGAMVVHQKNTNSLILINNGGQLFLCYHDNKIIVTSDILALEQLGISTKNCEFVEGIKNVELYKLEGIVKSNNLQIDNEKTCYMLSEILQQKEINSVVDFTLNPNDSFMVGCGSSHYAAKFVSHLLLYEPICILPDLPPPNRKNCIIVSQSGETYDLVKFLQKNPGIENKILLVNKDKSALERICDKTINIGVGPEIAVAATKSFTSQIVNLLSMFGVKIKKIKVDVEKIINTIDELIVKNIPQNVIVTADYPFIPIAQEVALKLKEVGRVHAEAIYCSQIKHGPLVLIDKCLTIMLNKNNELLNIIKSHGGETLVIEELIGATRNTIIDGIRYAIFGQVLSMKIAERKGLSVDRPEHICKSVTV